MMRTMPTNSPMMDVLNPSCTLLRLAGAVGSMGLMFHRPMLRSERIDVVDNRDLAQQYLANDVGHLHVIGKDGGVAGAAGRQAFDKPGIVESNPDDKGRRYDFLGRHRQS